MKAKCTITRKEFKKLLLKKRNETNAIYLTIFSCLFLIVCFKLILNNLLFMAFVYIFSIIFMTIILYIVNIIYTNIQLSISEEKRKNNYGEILVEATNTYLRELGETSAFKVLYSDVIYSKFTNNYFMIVDKETSLLLKKSFFEKEEDYFKIRNYVKKNVKGK